MKLPGKVAIVTGGAVRLGRAITLALAEAGMNICLHYGKSANEADQTRRAAEQLGAEVVTVPADFCDPVTAAETVVGRAVEAFGHVDVLINSAAIFEAGTIATTSEEHWDRHFDINLKAPFFLCRRFVGQLPPENEGQIVNITDWRAARPGTGFLAYTLTKSALATLTKSLAQELSPRIRVNGIAPGAILLPADKDPEYANELAAQIPMSRIGAPSDISDTLLFLLESDFITGEIVNVTGGQEL